MATTKNKQIFPIYSDTACLLKWSWSTIFFNSGTSASCHRTKKYKIDVDKFEEFHNLPGKILDRKKMLEGLWPGNGCEYCKTVEEAGNISDRLHQLSMQQAACLHPPELNYNAQQTAVTPTILEVYFTNTCNMACIYCGPQFSSRWEEENRKFKSNFDIGDNEFSVQLSFSNPNYHNMITSMWQYLSTDQRYLTLRKFHILGGEPFLIPETQQCLDFWDEHPNINLTLGIFSNLNIPHKIFQNYISKLNELVKNKKIWNAQIIASIDAWGDEQKYTRYGLDLDLWERNFEFLIGHQWLTIGINSAISGLTIKQMPRLIDKINEWNTIRTPTRQVGDNTLNEPIIFSFNTTGNYDDPYIFGKGIFDVDFNDIINKMPTNTSHQIGAKKQMQGIANTIAQKNLDIGKIAELKNYLTQLDYRRKTNWQETFPWLVKL